MKKKINPFSPKVAKGKIQQNFQVSLICYAEKSKQYHVKVVAKSFNLNCDTTVFEPHIQKLEPTFTAPSVTLGGEGKGQFSLAMQSEL